VSQQVELYLDYIGFNVFEYFVIVGDSGFLAIVSKLYIVFQPLGQLALTFNPEFTLFSCSHRDSFKLIEFGGDIVVE